MTIEGSNLIIPNGKPLLNGVVNNILDCCPGKGGLKVVDPVEGPDKSV